MDKKNKKTTLDQLKPGDKGTVVNVKIGGAIGQRLMSMGFINGTTLVVIRNAPLVDPIELQVRDSHVSIRHSEAKYIEVIRIYE